MSYNASRTLLGEREVRHLFLLEPFEGDYLLLFMSELFNNCGSESLGDLPQITQLASTDATSLRCFPS